ncbi:MAG TPA: class II aldolase/adducin family protein [Stellaceae bacterium]|nr:class II aldolase/adducin family protein [Stellaceae bacterium]
MSDETSLQAAIDDLVVANHILFSEGIVDGFGHVSMRHPTRPDHYLIARTLQPVFVTRADIVEHDIDSKPVAPDAPPTPWERFIHGEIYRVRPDVGAVVHSHAPSVLPFSVAGETPLRAICHQTGFLGDGAPIFEIRNFAGDSSNLLVNDIRLGAALAKTLGSSMAVLMRGHGFSVCGASLYEAVYNAVNTELNARIEMNALRLGRVSFLTPGEANAVSKTHNSSLKRNWEIWAKRAAGELR